MTAETAQATMPAATLADLKAERDRLEADRARRDYESAEAATIALAEVVRGGISLRDVSQAVLDQLLAHWALDVTGLTDETRVHHAMSLAAHDVLSAILPRVRAAAAAPALADAFARGATPRQVLTVSQWAARHRVLKSGTNSPGPWDNALTPYLTEIMDSLSEHSAVRYVTFAKSSGVGGTEVLYNWVGYVMHHLQNKDLLLVVPSLELRDRALNPRLAKVIDESPALSALVSTARRDRANRAELLEYGPRSRVIKAGANSPDSMRSDHLPYVICDEVSAFPWDVGGEGDPMTLIDNRQRTFSRAKSYFVSTPLTKGTCRITRLYEQSDQRTYHVPCPHCDARQALEFGGADVAHGLKWRTAPQADGERAQVLAAWYVCRSCGAEIEEKHKPAMLAQGSWVAAKPAVRHHRGYHINALYAPVGLGLGWRKVAQKWIDAQGDHAELKAFVNTYLGQPWTEEGDSIEATGLMARLEHYEADGKAVLIGPADGTTRHRVDLARITAGVDVQKDRLEATVAGWAEGEQCWLLAHVILPGDTAQPQVWADLHAELIEQGVQHACIDAGYHTSMVMAFCEHRAWAVPTKGMPGSHRPLVEDERKRRLRLRARRKRGAAVEPIGVDQGKALLYARLKLQQPGAGYVHFPAAPEFDDEYFAQLAAEKLVTRYRGTRPVLEWVRTRPRNEALDCLVLALAALRLGGAKLAPVPAPAQVGTKAAAATAATPPAPPDAAVADAVPAAAGHAVRPAAYMQQVQRLRVARRGG